MKKKEPFLPPEVRFTVSLELDGAILESSKDVYTNIVDTGHESFEYTTDSYWE